MHNKRKNAVTKNVTAFCYLKKLFSVNEEDIFNKSFHF